MHSRLINNYKFVCTQVVIKKNIIIIIIIMNTSQTTLLLQRDGRRIEFPAFRSVCRRPLYNGGRMRNLRGGMFEYPVSVRIVRRRSVSVKRHIFVRHVDGVRFRFLLLATVEKNKKTNITIRQNVIITTNRYGVYS